MPFIIIVFFFASFVFAEDSLLISKIHIQQRDVFDDAVVHTSVEKPIYEFGNWFHINTRESVIRARLPFKEGSTVSQNEIREAEKNLRLLPYISDARIETQKDSLGNTVLYVETSDNWTFSPAFHIGKPGEEWEYTFGILENNLFGLGHSVGFFYEHTVEREQKYLLYKSDDFFVPYNSFYFLWSENTDGFSRNLSLGYPFISRAKNQWAYNADLLWSKRDEKYYESRNPDPIHVMRLGEDSLSLWLLRSFGGTSFKTYLGIGYDYHLIGKHTDSRAGFSLAMSRIHLDKKYNLHKVKRAEDVERGYYIKATVAKTFENEDWYFAQNINLSLGLGGHNFLAKGQNSFYYNTDDIRDMHSILLGEYIFKPSLKWSSVFVAQIDSWQKTTYERQLYLDGNNVFPGFPANYLAGASTFAFKAEQRYFPGSEIFTLVPSYAVFLAAGDATSSLHAFEPHDLTYMAGIGLRFSNSKSVQGVVNHINLSWPLNGELKRGFLAPRFSFVGKLEL